jgi:hypothetical protein
VPDYNIYDEAHQAVLEIHPLATRRGRVNRFTYFRGGAVVAKVWRISVFKWRAAIRPKAKAQPCQSASPTSKPTS